MGLIGMSGRIQRKMTVNTVRIRRPDGTQRDARFEGDLVGGNLSLGDDISLWGHNAGGTLVVTHAYNHTTGSEIRLHRQTPWLSRIIATILLLLIFSILWQFFRYR